MKGAEPSCTECVPELFPENIDAMKIWELVSDQRIWVSGGLDKPICVGLRHEPIWKLIDEFNVDDRVGTFIKVLQVYENIHSLELARG